ncbi:hypothetical protein KSP40_PGU020614 [Platanthera guangdongensis]|uniref:Uncharacterized protein n=1 Tax=Platanthera guangdongensis TaxID=2320717 RepID=A0ABR2N1H4_9ASPA
MADIVCHSWISVFFDVGEVGIGKHSSLGVLLLVPSAFGCGQLYILSTAAQTVPIISGRNTKSSKTYIYCAGDSSLHQIQSEAPMIFSRESSPVELFTCSGFGP